MHLQVVNKICASAIDEKLPYVHFYLWGPTQNPLLSGSMYFLTIIDDCSRKTWVYALKTKDKTLDRFKT